jgi:acyl carrier protein
MQQGDSTGINQSAARADQHAQVTAQIYSSETITAWLITALAELLSIAPAELDIHEPLTSYGLNSLTGVILSGDIEHWLHLKLDPIVAWEYPTIATLASHLAAETATQQASK